MARKSSRRRHAPPRSPAELPEAVSGVIETLVESLAVPVEAYRRDNVDVVLGQCIPAVLALMSFQKLDAFHG
jgi:hypothetical protein